MFDANDHVGTSALVEAYQLHAATRTTRSLLFRATPSLEAMDQEEPLKTLGLHQKLVHQDPRLYLISQANLYQMLATEHRLYIHFSLHQSVDLHGKALVRLSCTLNATP